MISLLTRYQYLHQVLYYLAKTSKAAMNNAHNHQKCCYIERTVVPHFACKKNNLKT